jgi:hypothetical protein
MGHTENDASSNSSIVACVFVAKVTYLPSHCPATTDDRRIFAKCSKNMVWKHHSSYYLNIDGAKNFSWTVPVLLVRCIMNGAILFAIIWQRIKPRPNCWIWVPQCADIWGISIRVHNPWILFSFELLVFISSPRGQHCKMKHNAKCKWLSHYILWHVRLRNRRYLVTARQQLRREALLWNGWPQQYQGRVFYEVGSQAISRELRRVQLVELESSESSVFRVFGVVGSSLSS